MKLKPTWRIKLEHVTTGKEYRLALIPQPWKGRYWLRYNGSKSQKMPECTITSLMDECRKILVNGEKNER